MQICVLASGSTGNATYLQTPQHQILIDAGLSGAQIQKRLQQIGRSMENVDLLLVSHEHTDHAKGVGVLARRYSHLQVFANQSTWVELANVVGDIPAAQRHVFPLGTTQHLGALTIQSIGLSHDAASEQCYLIQQGSKRVIVITDTGYLSETVQHQINNPTAVVMECNYDAEMLLEGPYPWALKQRILSDTGHLSNEDGAEALANIIGSATQAVFLAHRSRHNNTRLVARETVATILQHRGLPVGSTVQLYDTFIHQPTKLIKL